MPADAIILAAGAGSRLRDVAAVKPLAEVQGRPLIAWLLDALDRAGLHRTVIVTGHGAAAVEQFVAPFGPRISTVCNPHWEVAPNGMSVLVAATAVREGTLLTMADHLLSDRLIARFLGEAPAEAALSLAIDRRLGNPDVDEADVTRVRTEAGRVRAIGKSLKVYDAYDTGLFRIGIDLLDALASLPAEQASLSAGVSILAARGQAAAVDIGDARWLDVDDPRALLRAEATWGAS